MDAQVRGRPGRARLPPHGCRPPTRHSPPTHTPHAQAELASLSTPPPPTPRPHTGRGCLPPHSCHLYTHTHHTHRPSSPPPPCPPSAHPLSSASSHLPPAPLLRTIRSPPPDPPAFRGGGRCRLGAARGSETFSDSGKFSLVGLFFGDLRLETDCEAPLALCGPVSRRRARVEGLPGARGRQACHHMEGQLGMQGLAPGPAQQQAGHSPARGGLHGADDLRAPPPAAPGASVRKEGAP